MEKQTIKLADAKKLAFGITEMWIHQCEDLLWIVTMDFDDIRYGYRLEGVGLETFRGELRIFKSADAAIKAALEVGFRGRISISGAQKNA